MLSILRQRAVKHFYLNTIKIKSDFCKASERTEFYFGYGANLSIDRFYKRKMNVEEVGNAKLGHHEIRFSLSNEYKNKGYAGVHPKNTEEVWGVLYKMDQLSLKLLDTLEWCGFGAYERKKVIVTTADQENHECWCYFVKYPKDNLFPSKTYLNNMIKASIDRGFPKIYLDKLKSHEFKEHFPIDHGYSLLFYGQRRILEKKLEPLYRIHDRLREKLCDLI